MFTCIGFIFIYYVFLLLWNIYNIKFIILTILNGSTFKCDLSTIVSKYINNDMQPSPLYIEF